MRPTTRWLLAAIGVASVVLALNGRLIAGAVGPKWDADGFFAPFFTLVADHARAGRLLRWDPWIGGGAPHSADPQVGAFSPLTVLVGAIVGGSEVGFRAYWLLLWVAGPLGLLVLGRRLGAPAWGGFVVATGFALSGFYTGHAEHTSLLYPIAWLPFILWRIDVALAAGRLRPAIEAGALWGLSGLAAYPLLAVLNAGFAGLWALGRWWWPADDTAVAATPARRPPGFVLVAGAGAVLTGVVVLAPAYVALLTETVGYSDRVGVLSREVAVGVNRLHPGALVTFASPYLALLKLHKTNPTLWAGTDVSTASVYAGASVTLLAVFALVARPRARGRWWIAGCGLLFLAAALGPALPLRGWLYDWLPPLRYFRHAGFFRVYTLVAAAVLGLLATRDLEAALGAPGAGPRRRLLATAAALAVAALGTVAVVLAGVPNRGEHPGRAAVHAGLVWGGLVAVAALATRGASGGRRLLPLALGLLAVTDASLTMSLTWPLVHEPGPDRRVWDRINAIRTAELDLTPHGLRREPRPPRWVSGPPSNKNIPLKIPTLENFIALGNRFHRDMVARPALAAMALGPERLWFAREAATVSPTDAAYAAFVARSEALGKPVAVLHPRAAMRLLAERGPAADDATAGRLIAQLPAAERLPVTVVRYTPTELFLAVTAPDRGWVLVTDRWAPGWQATLNGVSAEVLGGSFLFRALAVEPGPSELRFTYHPTGGPALVIASWATLLAVLAASVWAAARRPRPGKPGSRAW